MRKHTHLIAQSQQANQSGYMVQLDALRALAVLGVIVNHFLPQSFFFNSFLHWGTLGVQLFFLLSGYLITGILLRCRTLVDLGKQDVGFTIRRFYIRRFLRLVPIYYLVLATTAIINIEPVRKSLFWHLTYTSNIYLSIIGNWVGPVSHFWTLAVEEQFYLVWPCFILFLPKKHLLKLMFIAVAIGPLSRLLCIGIGVNEFWRWTLPFTNLDLLAMGAVLAFYTYNQEQFKQAKNYLCNLGFWVGIPLFITFIIINYHYPENVVSQVLYQTILCLCFVWLVDRAAQGFGGVTGTILELQPLIYLGKISYGIYVYHNFMPAVIPRIFYRLGLPYPKSTLMEFVVLTVTTLIVAVLSWHLIEKPINNLKRHFGYTKKVLS